MDPTMRSDHTPLHLDHCPHIRRHKLYGMYANFTALMYVCVHVCMYVQTHAHTCTYMQSLHRTLITVSLSAGTRSTVCMVISPPLGCHLALVLKSRESVPYTRSMLEMATAPRYACVCAHGCMCCLSLPLLLSHTSAFSSRRSRRSHVHAACLK
jgi:hypothetical protein